MFALLKCNDDEASKLKDGIQQCEAEGTIEWNYRALRYRILENYAMNESTLRGPYDLEWRDFVIRKEGRSEFQWNVTKKWNRGYEKCYLS